MSQRAAQIEDRLEAVEPLPRWAKTFMLVALGLVALVLVLVFVVDRTGPAQPAEWRLDPAGALDPSSGEVAILVHERACASGRDAKGRIEVDVDYAADAITLEVSVRPLNGDQDCQSNPDTPYIVKLAEPLGDREVMGQSRPPE